MIITWKIGYSDDLAKVSNAELAYQIIPLFGLDEDEYSVHSDHIQATPKAFAFKWISPIRFSVYDIILKKDSTKGIIEIRIRLYKLFIFPLMFPVLIFIAELKLIALVVGVIAYLFSLIFFGLMTFIELRIDKSKIKKKIKTLANNT